jgi:Nucleotide-sugar transporter
MSSALRDAAVPLLSLSSNSTDAANPSLVGAAVAAQQSPVWTTQRQQPLSYAISPSSTIPTVAQHGSDQNNHGLSSFQWILLGGLVLQYTAASLLWVHSAQGENLHGYAHPSHVALAVEVVKLVVSIAMEFHFYRSTETNTSRFSTAYDTLLLFKDSLPSAIPPMLFTLQQIFVSLGSIETTMLEMRTKLLMVAAVSMHLLHRSYSRICWICLVVFTISEELEVLNFIRTWGMPFPGVGRFIFTVVVIAIAMLMGAVATVYSEKIMKQSTSSLFSHQGSDTTGSPVSFWMHSLQFSFFGSLAAALLMLPTFHEEPLPSFGHGFTFAVWTVILAQASAGIWLLAVIKYTDSVFSVMAIFVSALTTDMMLIMFSSPGSPRFTLVFALGAFLKVTSLYAYCKHYRPVTGPTEPERMMDEGDTTVELGELLGGADGWHAERRSADAVLGSLYLTEEGVASPHEVPRRF